MKPNKPYLRIFNMLLIMVAYGYLVYRLTIFDDYSSFLAAFKTANIGLWFTLVAIILLMPLNVVAEAGKWRLLLRKTEPMTIWGAQRQVYYGYVGAFITPYHAGDYPARAMLLKDKGNFSAAVGLGLVGTISLLIVELIFGIPATWLFISYNPTIPMQYFAVAFIVLVLLLSFLPHLVRYLSVSGRNYLDGMLFVTHFKGENSVCICFRVVNHSFVMVQFSDRGICHAFSSIVDDLTADSS